MLSKKSINNFKDRISFWRQNPHRFIVDYLGIKLKPFQEIIVYEMNDKEEFVWIAARGLSKSFTTAVFMVAMSILYPGYKVVITSGTKGQAGKVLTEKIEGELMRDYPRIKEEILDVKSGSEPSIKFKNGSVIISATPNDSARGLRANLVVLDESRMIPSKVVKTIFEEMLQNRMFKLVDESIANGEDRFKDYVDVKPKVIHMSSAWFKNNHLWNHYKNIYKRMVKGDNVFAVSIPYHLGVKERIIPREKIVKLKKAADFNPISFSIESESLFFGEGENAFFKLEMFNRNRQNMQVYEVYDDLYDYDYYKGNWSSFLEKHHSKYKKQDGEKRIMSIDVAPMSGGQGNDNTIVTFKRLIPTDKGFYERRVVNVVPYSNMTEEEISVCVKRQFYMFQADAVALDIQGTSRGLFSHLITPSFDNDTGEEFKAWKVYDSNMTETKKNEYIEQTRYDDCEEVIYAVGANADFNHEGAMNLRASLKSGDGRYKILPPAMEGREFIISKFKKGIDPYKLEIMTMPYLNTDAMINECILLEGKIMNGKIKLSSVGANRKDRFSALMYSEQLAREFDKELDGEKESEYQFTFRS